MIITRTPLRIPLAGGGTDLPVWSKRHGSMFISAAINKYVYITYHRSLFDKSIRIRYSKMEEVENVEDVKNEIVRETLKFFSIKDSVELTSHAEIPSGTGLGSSGSFGVGVLKALYSGATKRELAEIASKIQMEKLDYPIGVQDQYVASFGGLNTYTVNTKGFVSIKSLKTDYKALQDRLCLFFTGFKRDANEIINSSSVKGLDEIQKLGYQIKEALEKKDLDKFGELMNQHWEFKKKRGDMTNPEIDSWYELGLKNGALGGKLIGAGGGGFLMFYTKDPQSLINKMPLQYVPFRFDFEGSKLINDK